MRIRGGRVGLLVALALALARPGAGAGCAMAVDLDSVVHPVMLDILDRATLQAQEQHCQFLLLRLNTPGGFLEAMRDVVQKIVTSPLPVVTFVCPSGARAASAGFFLLEAGDLAVMAPGTNTGAAHPIMLGGQQEKTLIEKATSDSAASLRSIVARRGRNADLAEKAVTESRSFTDREALDARLIDLIARDEADLLAQIHGREVTRFSGETAKLDTKGARIITYERNLKQKVQTATSDPNIALAFLVLGALGVYLEFTSPGMIIPGVAGAILALLGLSAFTILPVSWTGVALLVLALVLFALEVKVASHGVLALGGAVAMVLGALLLIDSPLPEVRVRLSTAIALALPFALITAFLVTLIVRARLAKVETGMEGMLGSTGEVLVPLEPEGKVMVKGEIWDARASAAIPVGARVRVISLDGFLLTVEPVDDRKGE